MTQRHTTLRTSWIAGLMGLVVISAIDFSSYCHPTEAGEAATDAVRRSGAARMTEADEATPPLAPIETAWREAPKPITWQQLEDVDFKDVYVEELDAYYWKPTFGDQVEALRGKDVYITGYIIPVDVDEDFYVLSRFPFANCFFCGGAGPESVIDLRWPAETPRPYATDERLTFKGTFRLNADDIYQMNYILEGAAEYNP